MKKSLFVVIVLLFSCKGEIQKKNDIITQKEDTLNVIQDSSDEVVSISMGYTYPFGDGEEEKWLAKTRRAIKRDGNEDSYWDLDIFYGQEENRHLSNEMIELTEIMIKKHNRKSTYLSAYYFSVKNSNPVDTFKMKKGINYLKEILRNSRGKIDLPTVGAQDELSRLYRDGIYVTKDTVIANYLKKGGLNIDSIIQERSKPIHR